MLLDKPAPTFAQSDLLHSLQLRGHAFLQADQTQDWLRVRNHCWLEFADFWHALAPDRHMADGGRYRLRRYGRFGRTRTGGLEQLPHAPYEQPLHINPLNGGVARHFEPLEKDFADHPALRWLLLGLSRTLDALAPSPSGWAIDAHAYRILAEDGVPGRPSPEGLHRDGVDYVVSLLVQRHNIDGGITTLTDAEGRFLARRMLVEPLDLLLLDDLALRHDVSPVHRIEPQLPGYRDVLVLAFTRQ